MTSTSYFDKMNSTLGSVVPLAMFLSYVSVSGLLHILRDNNNSPRTRIRQEGCRAVYLVTSMCSGVLHNIP